MQSAPVSAAGRGVKNHLDFNTAGPQAEVGGRPTGGDDLEALRSALRNAAPGLVRDLFPLARFQGNEARIGSVQGEPGESLSIVLGGEKAGQWYDHNPTADRRQGDLIDLWQAASGGTFSDAVQDLQLHLGLRSGAKSTGRVARKVQQRAAEPRPPTLEKTLEHTYVYTDAVGLLLAKVMRYRLSNGKKTFSQWRASDEEWKSPEVRPLYNLPGIAREDTVVMVEGEKAADALIAMDVTATTVMGGSATNLDKCDLRPLAGKTVLLWPDNDAAGRSLMERIELRLKLLGCRVAWVFVPSDAPEKWDAADAGDGALALLRDCYARVERMETTRLPDQQHRASRGLRLLRVSDLASLPKPEWLLQDLVPTSSFVIVVGPPASMKTFVVLEWAICIAHGVPWLGHQVRQGTVVYVAGEGHWGLAKRVLGLLDHKRLDVDTDRFLVVEGTVAMPTGQLDELLVLIRGLPEPPVMIVLDTLARTFGAGDENSQKDMNAYVAACDRLREETGATVLVVHHTGKDVERGARGSSVLTGAADTIIAVKRQREHLSLINKAPAGKQKDADEHPDIHLRGMTHRFRRSDGLEEDTIVLLPDESPPAGDTQVGSRRGLTRNEEKIVAVFELHGQAEGGLTNARVVQLSGLNSGTVSSQLKSLELKGYLQRVVDGKRPRWRWLGTSS